MQALDTLPRVCDTIVPTAMADIPPALRGWMEYSIQVQAQMAGDVIPVERVGRVVKFKFEPFPRYRVPDPEFVWVFCSESTWQAADFGGFIRRWLEWGRSRTTSGPQVALSLQGWLPGILDAAGRCLTRREQAYLFHALGVMLNQFVRGQVYEASRRNLGPYVLVAVCALLALAVTLWAVYH